MQKFIVQGGQKLEGEIEVKGSKNAALPILAATLLTDEECIIKNLPKIADIETMKELLRSLGAKVEEKSDHELTISCKDVNNYKLDDSLVRKLRASILLMGPLIAKFKKADMLHPGGCIIGKRQVETHFLALEALGVKIESSGGRYIAEAKDLNGSEVYLDEVSVTATENAIMAAVLAKGITKIKNAACEPHVQDLAKFLNSMGAKIKGAGSHTVIIEGVEKLRGTEHTIVSDQIETGTFAVAAAATHGDVKIKDPNPENLDPILFKLKAMGVKFELGKDYLHILPTEKLFATKIQTDTWPGFPTDLQAPFTVLATQAQGTSLIHDWMYEGRLLYTDELNKMGANITVCDPHRALTTGPTPLCASHIVSPDIRAGIALVIAAMIAKGKSEIDNVELIDRGYEDIEGRLGSLGAKIQRVKS